MLRYEIFRVGFLGTRNANGIGVFGHDEKQHGCDHHHGGVFCVEVAKLARCPSTLKDVLEHSRSGVNDFFLVESS